MFPDLLDPPDLRVSPDPLDPLDPPDLRDLLGLPDLLDLLEHLNPVGFYLMLLVRLAVQLLDWEKISLLNPLHWI